MDPLRSTLLTAYRIGTAGRRRRELRRRSERGIAPVAVLFYHRIADTHPNGWTLSTRRFRRQLDWLADRFEFVSLAEGQRRLAEGANPRPAVAITFDDGYGDNCDAAIPLLLERRIPFTYFVTTDVVRDQTAFPHDLEAGVRLRPNSIEELRAMADAGVDLGAHTRTHVDLGRVTDPRAIEDEIVGSRSDLEDWIGRRVRYFAFPFGLPKNLTPRAAGVIASAGFDGFCSAYGAYNLPERVAPGQGATHLRRIHADPEWSRFVNWMTFDPRKLAADDPIDDAPFLPPRGSDERVPATCEVGRRG